MRKWLLPAAGVAAVAVAIVGTLALAGAFDGGDDGGNRAGDEGVAEDGDSTDGDALGICVEGTVDCVDTPLEPGTGDTCPVGTEDCVDTPTDPGAAGGTCLVGTEKCEDTPGEPATAGCAPDDLAACEERMIVIVTDDLVRRTGVEVVLVSSEYVDWPDASLGNPQPGQLYAQAITPGFKIILESGGETYEYHTDTGGAFTLVE